MPTQRPPIASNSTQLYLSSNNAYTSSTNQPMNSSTTMGGITTYNSYTTNLLIKKNTRKAYAILDRLAHANSKLKRIKLPKSMTQKKPLKKPLI